MSVDRWIGKGQIFKFCSKIIDFSIAAPESSTSPKGKVVNDQAASFSWLRVPFKQNNLPGRRLQLVFEAACLPALLVRPPASFTVGFPPPRLDQPEACPHPHNEPNKKKPRHVSPQAHLDTILARASYHRQRRRTLRCRQSARRHSWRRSAAIGVSTHFGARGRAAPSTQRRARRVAISPRGRHRPVTVKASLT